MSRKNVSSAMLLLLICGALLATPASAQHLQEVKGTLVTVSAGRNEVFGIDPHGAPWRYNATKQSFAKINGAKSLVQIAVGGGTLSQLDEVWAVASNGDVYRFNYNTKAFDQISGASLSQIAVGVGVEDDCHAYEVWGITPGLQVGRYDYCSSQFHQSPGSFLAQISTGAGDVWGIIGGQIYQYSFTAENFVEISGALAQIAVGVNDVWGVDTTEEVSRYDPNTGSFDLYVNGGAARVAAGGDGV